MIEKNFVQLSSSLKIQERQQERGFSELAEKLKEQDLGQDIRVKTKLICTDWNDKIMEIDVLAKNGQKFQKRVD